jgi:glycosyltransferase involved in cell wall biosynthesis
MAEPLLSICLPIYNQAAAFEDLVRSIADAPQRVKDRTEFVIVDDCSSDDLSSPLHQLRSSGWQVTWSRNKENMGRAPALARSVRGARGRYILIMDGDDPFVEEGLAGICEALVELEASPDARDCLGLVFGTLIDDGASTRRNALPEGLQCTLLALRADHRIKGDLKEVIRRDAVSAALCPLFDRFRRVPTSLLWARISEVGTIRCSSKIVVHKSYQSGGLTRNLDIHRKVNLPPLLALYQRLVESTAYRSRAYRFRAAVNYHRFLARYGSWRHVRGDFWGMAALTGVPIGLLERARRS